MKSCIERSSSVLASCVAFLLTATSCEQSNVSRFGRLSSDFAGARSANVKALGIPAAGTEMDAPQKFRFYRYWNPTPPPDPGVSSCFPIPGDSAFHTILSETFTTATTTSFVDLSFNAQFTVFSGSGGDPYRGILARATAIQGSTPQKFPGIGDEFDPFMARLDEAENGQQVYGGYEGVLTADPSTSTTVMVELASTVGQAYACFFNMIVRY